MTMARTTKRTDRTGTPYFIGDAFNRRPAQPLYQCNACMAEVVWLESTRTGRMYLVDVSATPQRYIPNKPHQCSSKGSHE